MGGLYQRLNLVPEDMILRSENPRTAKTWHGEPAYAIRRGFGAIHHPLLPPDIRDQLIELHSLYFPRSEFEQRPGHVLAFKNRKARRSEYSHSGQDRAGDARYSPPKRPRSRNTDTHRSSKRSKTYGPNMSGSVRESTGQESQYTDIDLSQYAQMDASMTIPLWLSRLEESVPGFESVDVGTNGMENNMAIPGSGKEQLATM